MTLEKWMEVERERAQWAQPMVRDMQDNYFEVITNLLEVIKALDFPVEQLIVVEDE